MKSLEQLTRKNIWSLAPYSSARNEYAGREARVFLDANENPYNQPYNRYPDPLQLELKAQLSKVKGVPADCIFLGNGSDEAIDLPYRCFCEPGKDNVVAIEPTYGMYKVCADINDVEYRPVLLDEQYQITADKLLAATDDHTKIIWLCTPNNPTGNSLNRDEVVKVIEQFEGLVIVDEAYSDFASQRSLRFDLAKYPNLIVLNTMSKAWGCAAIRLGMAFASKEIIELFNKVKYPYNVNALTQQQALEALKRPIDVDAGLYRTAHLRESVSHGGQLLPGKDERRYPHLQLSRGSGYHRQKPHPRATLSELPPHHHRYQEREQRTHRRPPPISVNI